MTLQIARPAGVAGQFVTLDRSVLATSPGARSTETHLELSLRSSRGGLHVVTLPEGAELESLAISGRAQPLRQDGRRVTLTLAPGVQIVSLAWREPRGIGVLFRTPAVDVGLAGVNAQVGLQLLDRWTLAVGGPRMGPAVLFWSLFVVILLLAWGLARLKVTPLSVLQWALLGVGLSQLPLVAAAVVAAWLILLGLRRRAAESGRAPSPFLFDLYQLLLVAWTIAAIGILFWGVQQGLLGEPEMQIEGNGSTANLLTWYADRSAPVLPVAWALSVPLFVYRLAMLAWALWLALALLSWLRWGWESLTLGGGWRPLLRKRQPQAAAAPPAPPAATAPPSSEPLP
ncbi:MAG TPA: hypothetical protein VGE98_02135 [Thermoanaerobaculia bacterium]